MLFLKIFIDFLNFMNFSEWKLKFFYNLYNRFVENYKGNQIRQHIVIGYMKSLLYSLNFYIIRYNVYYIHFFLIFQYSRIPVSFLF